jgi:hypothetical protein
MKISMDELLRLVGEAEARKDLLRLAREYGRARRGRVRGEASSTTSDVGRETELLDAIMHRVQLAFRAVRRPLPTREEIEEMLRDQTD